jgi:hypothetical protein
MRTETSGGKFHSITSSASASNLSGIAKPNVFAGVERIF